MNHNWEYDYSNLYPNGANDTGAANGADAAGVMLKLRAVQWRCIHI